MKGRKVIVIGGGSVALRKVRSLLEFGADMTIISAQPDAALLEMAAEGLVQCECRTLTCPEDEMLLSAFLVICATDDKKLNREIADYCEAHQIWVDCADSAEKSSVVFPSVVKRDEIVIGISTSGGVPALTRHLRERIEETVPEWYGTLEHQMRNQREVLKQTDCSMAEKRKYLEMMISEAERGHEE
jgi:precorrin-2 dehydrogenase/sirohydrochlorin ferrochelatase